MVLNKAFTKAINAVTEPVTREVMEARLKVCGSCERLTTVQPTPGVKLPGCGICRCPIDTLTASKRHPEALEGKISTKMVKTICKHPSGSKWAATILLLFTATFAFAQLDTFSFEPVGDIDTVGFSFYSLDIDTFGNETYQVQRRASKEVVRAYMEKLAKQAVVDSAAAIRADFPTPDGTGTDDQLANEVPVSAPLTGTVQSELERLEEKPDNDTQLSEAQVDAFVANNNYSTGPHTIDTDDQTASEVSVASPLTGNVQSELERIDAKPDANTQLSQQEVRNSYNGQAANGDLRGTYPNPIVVGVYGNGFINAQLADGETWTEVNGLLRPTDIATQSELDAIQLTPGPQGDDGVGITGIANGSPGSFVISLSDNSTFTTPDFRGSNGTNGRSITSATINGSNQLVITFSSGPAYTSASLKGSKGDKGNVGATGTSGRGIASEAYNASTGKLTLTFTDNSSYTTGDLRGSDGVDGNTGPSGPQGAPGIDGTNGVDGSQGPQGVAGPIGPQGVKGDQGLAGSDGAPGPKGDQGDTGPQGVAGADGQDGAIGPKGDTGDQGPIGLTGPKGDKGDQGNVGPAGPQGDPATDDQTAAQVPVASPLTGNVQTALEARPTQSTVTTQIVNSSNADRAYSDANDEVGKSPYVVVNSVKTIDFDTISSMQGHRSYLAHPNSLNDPPGSTYSWVEVKNNYVNQTYSVWVYQYNENTSKGMRVWVRNWLGYAGVNASWTNWRELTTDNQSLALSVNSLTIQGGTGVDLNELLLTGDVGATVGGNTVYKINGMTVRQRNPAFGEFFVWDGGGWIPGPVNTVKGIPYRNSGLDQGEFLYFDGSHWNYGRVDDKIQGRLIETTTPNPGEFLFWDGSRYRHGLIPSSHPGATGDITRTAGSSATSVAKLLGTSLHSSTSNPVDGQVLTYHAATGTLRPLFPTAWTHDATQNIKLNNYFINANGTANQGLSFLGGDLTQIGQFTNTIDAFRAFTVKANYAGGQRILFDVYSGQPNDVTGSQVSVVRQRTPRKTYQTNKTGATIFNSDFALNDVDNRIANANETATQAHMAFNTSAATVAGATISGFILDPAGMPWPFEIRYAANGFSTTLRKADVIYGNITAAPYTTSDNKLGLRLIAPAGSNWEKGAITIVRLVGGAQVSLANQIVFQNTNL